MPASQRSVTTKLIALIVLLCAAVYASKKLNLIESKPPSVAPVAGAPSTVPTTQATTAPAASPAKLTLDLGKGQSIDLVLIPAGTFVMGSPETEAGEDRDSSEGPQHTVHIAKPFFIGKNEVTQAQWIAVGGPNQSHFNTGDLTLPAECVSWTDAQKFCKIAAERTGRKFRLPSEAEWEYTARAGTSTPWYTGKDLSSTQANFNGKEPGGNAPKGENRDKTIPVGSFPPNAFGVYDMIGNVGEWCQDVMHDSYKGAPTDGSAWEAGDPAVRVYRGGAYNNSANSCRSAMRYATPDPENNRNQSIGFRVVVEQ